jgi:cardiolipin synthase
LQTYVFDLDTVGIKVCHELIQAAQKGVSVFLVIDSVGSKEFTDNMEFQLVSAGVHFFRFNGIRLKWLHRWGRRLHHKVLLIDYSFCFVGGINVQSAYDAGVVIPRLDFAAYLEGPIALKLGLYCEKILKKAYGKKIHFLKVHPKTEWDARGLDVSLLVNDWVFGYKKIDKQYTRLISEATRDITIINPYFFPRRRFMKLLVESAKRGVRVRLILPTVSDWPSYILASEYLYSYFLKNNVEIYQWKKSVLHGKLASVDGQWVTIGSYNLNYTSYLQNLEVNVNIHSDEFTEKLNIDIDRIIDTGCSKIDPIYFSTQGPLRMRASRLFYYLVLSFIANLSIGLTFPEERNRKYSLYGFLYFIASLFFFVMGVIGVFVPILPSIPFFAFSFLLIYRQNALNRKTT